VQSNNVNYATYTAAGLVDPVKLFPDRRKSNIDKGTAIARVTDDIDESQDHRELLMIWVRENIIRILLPR